MRSQVIAIRGRSYGDWFLSEHFQKIELRWNKRRLVFYPTLYKDVVVHTPTRKKIGTLTAFYSHGVGGFDLRQFVLEILEKK